MQYISPVFLLDTANPQQLDKKSILLSRKKMLAELELHGGQTVTIKGRQLTKNDIINFFNALQQTNNLAWHVAIAADPVLLKFLEESVLEKGAWFKKNASYKEDGFVEWISPYYYSSFISFGEFCINKHLDVEWKTLLGNPHYMTLTDMYAAWDIIERLIREDLENLQFFVHNTQLGEGDRKNNHYIEILAGYTYTGMLQALPARFAWLKDEYANAVMQCAIRVFNDVSSEKGIEIIGYALKLVASVDVKLRIEETQTGMFNAIAKANRTRKSKRWISFASFICIFILLRTVACKDDAERIKDITNLPLYYLDTTKTLRQTDSTGFEPAPPQQELDSADIRIYSPAENKK
jgi:hypothetical protein